MKTVSKSLLALAVMGILTTACKKEEEEPQTPPKDEGTLVVKGESYVLTQGILEDYGQDTSWHQGTNFDLTLFTDGLNYITQSGTGQLVYFEMFSSSNEDLAAGTYTYNQSLETGTFDIGEIYDVVDGMEGDFLYSVIDGSIDVSKTDDRYTISGSLTAVEANSLDTANIDVDYSGKISMY